MARKPAKRAVKTSPQGASPKRDQYPLLGGRTKPAEELEALVRESWSAALARMLATWRPDEVEAFNQQVAAHLGCGYLQEEAEGQAYADLLPQVCRRQRTEEEQQARNVAASLRATLSTEQRAFCDARAQLLQKRGLGKELALGAALAAHLSSWPRPPEPPPDARPATPPKGWQSHRWPLLHSSAAVRQWVQWATSQMDDICTNEGHLAKLASNEADAVVLGRMYKGLTRCREARERTLARVVSDARLLGAELKSALRTTPQAGQADLEAAWDALDGFLKGYGATLAGEDDEPEWDGPHSPEHLRRVFKVSLRTMARWLARQVIRNRKLSTKAYLVDRREMPDR
jgi:hypothetical protein